MLRVQLQRLLGYMLLVSFGHNCQYLECTMLTLILRIPSLIYDLTLLSLVIYKTVKFWMDGGIDSVPGLVVTLVRDQCLYFLVYASLPPTIYLLLLC